MLDNFVERFLLRKKIHASKHCHDDWHQLIDPLPPSQERIESLFSMRPHLGIALILNLIGN